MVSDNCTDLQAMNELQQIEFDLFLCFDEICKKLDLKYFLLSGSALGAVRHGGFIPWDDDLDVGMYREDYNKFMELAPSMLPKEYFLQNYKTDPKTPFVFAKLRNSNTAFIETAISKFHMHHGIYIDIFPLDGYPEKASAKKHLEIKKKIFQWKLHCGFDIPRRFRSAAVSFVLRLLGYHKRLAKTNARFEALISRYKVADSDIVCSHGNRYGAKDYMPKEIYGEGVYMTFEGVQARIPAKYDEYLTRLYGDWHTPPPMKEREVIHSHTVCDTKKSYVEYMK